ncbi:MAG: MbnP family protein [Salibacteraceae bacterium]
MKKLLYFSFLFLIISISSCNTTESEPCPVVKEPFSLAINQKYNSQELMYFENYKSIQGNDMWFTKSKFYLSNVVAVKSNGDKKLIADIVLLDYSLDSAANQISGNIEQGDYVGIEFDLGVREDYNSTDPATFAIDHPLSITKNMYWGWASMYIFAKLEGFEVHNNDTNSFVIHTGTQDLYRPNVKVNFDFVVSTGGSEASIDLDIYDVLYQSNYTFDLYNDGQTHTLDNLQLAIHYMDNFTNGFSK